MSAGNVPEILHRCLSPRVPQVVTPNGPIDDEALPDYATYHIGLPYLKLATIYPKELAMIQLRDKATGQHLGVITETDLQFLIDQLEEESLDDKDYYIHRVTLAALADQGASQALMDVLAKALGDRDDMEFEWSKG